MSEHTISNQTCTKCQHCGQWTNYAGDEHHQAREAEFAALRKDSDYLVTSELMRAEVIQQRDELLAAAKIGEDFMSGFEGDELQEGIAEHLATIRAAIAKAKGAVLIHASKTRDLEGYSQALQICELLGITLPPLDDLPKGGIVGEATLHDCVTESDSPWFVGKFGFLLRDARPLPFVPFRGRLGFFNVRPEDLS